MAFRTNNTRANIFWTTDTMASTFRARTVRVFAIWTQYMSSRRRVLRQMSSRRYVQQHQSCGRGVSGYFSFWTQSVKAKVLRMMHTMVLAILARRIRVFAIWMQRMSYRHRVSRKMCSRQFMPWRLPSGREVSWQLCSGRSSCLTDAKCHGKFLPDTECQRKCPLDNACHSICLRDSVYHGSCLP